ncbi:hypothetical protein [Caedibacter taeniospiralis]|jgi:hypothetical protein|uniref:hypothetical protein n=1 Tax=Caedibacter taeniospiralis TaxID=28907 RepID=UPI0037C03719
MATFILRFDPIEYARKLRGAGMTQDQADIQAQELERLVEQQNEVLQEKFEQHARTIQDNSQKLSNLEAKELATKGDLREVELCLLKEIEVVRKEIEALKFHTLKFIIWTGVGVSVVLISTLGGMMAKGFGWW